MKNKLIRKLVIFCLLAFLQCKVMGQTLFESASGDGVISFSKSTTSQIRLNLASTGLTYGYYFVNGKSTHPCRLIFSAEVKAKPNDDGIATLVKTGELQPGFEMNGSIGFRVNDNLIPNHWDVLDVSVKPVYKINGYSLYDSTRIASSLDPFYKTSKNSFGVNIKLNFGIALGKTNAFLGGQLGINGGNNWDDLDEGTIQTVKPDPSNLSRQIFSNVESVKFGAIENKKTRPLGVDFIFDPNIKLTDKDATTIKLGLFTYYRTDLKENKHRNGIGLCLIDSQDPSKIFSSLGYELPTSGSDVDPGDRKKDKGILFVSIGFTFF